MSEVIAQQEALQDLPNHMIFLDYVVKVDLSQISKDVLMELLSVSNRRLGEIRTKLKVLREQYPYLHRHVALAEESLEVKEEYQKTKEIREYQSLVVSRINTELSRRKNKSKKSQLRTLEQAFMDRARATLTPTLFSRIQKEAFEELRVDNEQNPPGSAEYEAFVARALEAKRAANRSVVNAENASRHDTRNDQMSSVYTLIGGLPSLGKRR